MADTEDQEERCETPPKEDDLGDPKDDDIPPRGNLDRQRSYSTASLAARTKLATLIQITSSAESEGKTDHKKIADNVFDSLVGGTFDLENRFTIQDCGDLLIILELLEHCNDSLKVEILGLLIAILRKSVPNLQAATKIGLIERILCRLPNEPEIVAHKLVELLGILSSYSITVKELKCLLGALRGEQYKWPRHAIKLLKVLKLMLEKHGPDVYFNFTGQDGAAITLPPISKWPLQSGFAFSTWICLDTSHIADAVTCKPYLYCFRTGKGLGYSAHFSGPMLVLEAAVKAGKKENKVHTHLVKFDFHPQKWYMVTVVYTYNRFRSSEVRCFVNGKLSSSGELTLLNTNEPFDKCYIGSSPKADFSSVFHGQTAAVYVFSETLAPNTIATIHRLGPGYMGQFKFESEIDIPLSEQDKKVLYDGHLATSIIFMYSPKACDQQLCMEASPTENASYFCHSPHALMLEGVQAVITHSFQSALHSLGGIQMLLPLFTQLDFTQDENDNTPDLTICAVLLSLLSDLLKSSSTSQQQMMRCQGFLVISDVLEKAQTPNLTEQSLNILLSLARYLLYTPGSGPLLGNLLDHILFNPNLWVKTSAKPDLNTRDVGRTPEKRRESTSHRRVVFSFLSVFSTPQEQNCQRKVDCTKVQLHLFSVFATDLVTGVGCAAHIRRDVGVRRLMYMLKKYYWLEQPYDEIDTGASRPSKDDIKSLRAFLLLLVKQLVLKDHGIAEDELYGILAYLVANTEEENVLDVLQLVLSIMTEKPEAAVPALDKVDGLRAIFNFLDASLESIRVYALKVIGCFIHHCNPRRKVELLQHYGLFSLIGTKLMLHGLTMTTYNVLFEILVGRVSKQILNTRHPEPDDTYVIHNPNLCLVIVKMLHQIDEKEGVSNTLTKHHSFSGESLPNDACTSPSPSDKIDIKKIFLSDLVLLLHHSKENRSILLQLSCWQDWLFSLAYIEPKDKVEHRTTDTVFSLFRMLLHHSFQEEREGWRIWVDTLAILHGKVSQYTKEKERKEAESGHKTKKCKSGSRSLVRTKSASEIEARPTSPEADDERRKFFQSLLKAKSSSSERIGPIPEEKESAEETPAKSEELPHESIHDKPEASNGVSGSSSETEKEINENTELPSPSQESGQDIKSESPVPASDETVPTTKEHITKCDLNDLPTNATDQNSISPKDEQNGTDDESRSTTGVGSDVRGTEIAGSNMEVTSKNIPPPGHPVRVNTSGEEEEGTGVTEVDSSEKDNERCESPLDEGVDVTPPNQSTAEGGNIGEDSEPVSTSDKKESVSSETGENNDKVSQEGSSTSSNGAVEGMSNEEQTEMNHKTDDDKASSQKTANDNITDSELMPNQLLAERTTNDQDPISSELLVERTTNDQDSMSSELLVERTPNDQDSNLIVTMKSSFIGASTASTPEEKPDSQNTSNQEKVTADEVASGSTTSTQSPDLSGSASEGTSTQGSPTRNADTTSASPEEASQYRAYINIPEFLWSTMHQRLLGDLLFAIESDLQVWRSHTRKSVMDFVNSKENTTYLWNLAHFVSVLADNVIYACGDLLPLLSSVTSRDYTQDVIQPCGGMSLESSYSFLNRLMSLVDVIVFTSSLAFSGVEANRNMSSGGFLRQCLRLVFCCAARNRLVCRQRNRPIFPLAKDGKVTKKTLKETREAIKALISSTEPPSEKDMLQNIPGHVTTVTDPEKLLQEMDVNRLRAVVYRDFEDSRQAQFLALTVVYFIAVMMVAKYRDLLKSDEREARSRCNTVPSPDALDDAVNGLNKMRGRAVSWTGKRSKTQESEDDVFAGFSQEDAIAFPSLPKTTGDFNRLSLSEKVEVGFKSCGSLLKEILLDFSPFLSRVLIGSHGQELVFEGLSCQKSDSSVELVMLLCSQEWQNSLQRHGGAAFMELINEGRLLSHAMRERIVVTTSEAYVIMTKLETILKQKHFQYEGLCNLTRELYVESEDIQSRMLVAASRRDSSVAKGLLIKIQDKLTCEQGAWAPEEAPEEVCFSRLDLREDDSRKRRCLVRNPHGSSHPEATLITVLEDETQQPTSDSKQALNFAKISSSAMEDSYSLDDEDSILSDVTLDEKILELDDTGHVILTTLCHVIAPCVVVPGSLTITSTALFFSVDEDDEEYHKLDPKVLLYMEGLHGKWHVDQIKAIFSRRYLLQNCAAEIFFASGTSALFKFADHQVVKKVVRALPPVGVGSYYGIIQTRAASLYSPKQLFQKSTMTIRWQRGEIDNFQYLMFLNTIAGRTYCDLNQYPVFPWVLTNYQSPTLDLKDPNNYRDLSKPIGTLNPSRHSQFLERYASWDENDDIPPFHYGTHYSTSGFTLAWLIRLEPFATQFLNLQGGKFDHPGRTFCSINTAWKNCQRDTSDVKELIPELFYLPEMFHNNNRFTFGVDDDGTVIDDVELPPWALSINHFVTLHKAALESEHVSSHLHEWIDLIFGFKQRGPEAVKATNVFFHLTYEGSVDLDAISDSVMKEAVQQQIKSFGQTPSQLLLEPHPTRVPLELQTHVNQEPFKSIYLTFKVTENVPVTFVAAHTDTNLLYPAVVTISCNQCFSMNRWINTDSTQSLRGAQIEQDPMLATPVGRQRRQLGEPLDQTVTPSASCFVVTSDNRAIMACGYWDNSFKCFSSDGGKLTQCVFGHWDVVTCLAYNQHVGLMGGSAIVVSGSRDATVLVWHWNERHQRVTSADRSIEGAPSPIAILTGHEQPITCVDVSASLGLVVSGSQEGPCLVHTITGDRLHILYGPLDCIRPRLVRVIHSGLIIVSYTDNTGHLAVFTINGKMLESSKLDDHVLGLAVSKDGLFMLAGGFSRYLTVWRTNDLALIHTYPPCDGSIRALAISTDQKCLVAGLASGSILAIATDFTRWPLT